MSADTLAAEEHVLGSILLEPSIWSEVSDLSLTNFGAPAHRALYQTLAELAANGGIVDFDHVVEHLAQTERLELVGGIEALERLRDETTTWTTAALYAAELRQVTHQPPVTKHPKAKPQRKTGRVLEPEGSAYVEWQRLGLDCNGNGQPYPTLGNTALLIAQHPDLAGKIWRDTFRAQVWHTLRGTPEPWTDSDALRLTAWINQTLRLPKIGLPTVHHAVDLVAANESRNSVTEWLESLTWDGTPRLDHWLSDCLGVERTAYTMAVARNWLVSMVARAYRPGCQADHMPVLEGASGAGKSSALAVLGGEWYRAAPQAFGSKAFLEAIQGAWLVEIPDMVGFGRSEHTLIIAAITTRCDPYRASYGRVSEDHPRTCIFAATSETDQYLDDSRGRRRYWPLRCTEINLEVLRATRDQLFAEATVAFKQGSTWHLVPSVEASAEQAEREVVDVWDEIIERFLAGRTSTSLTEVVSEALQVEIARQDRSVQMRAAKCLKRLGFSCKIERIADKTRRIYRR